MQQVERWLPAISWRSSFSSFWAKIGNQVTRTGVRMVGASGLEGTYPGQSSAVDDLAIGCHQRDVLARGDPDVEGVGGPKARYGKDRSRRANGARSEGHDSARGEMSLEERGDPIGCDPATDESRSDFEIEDARDDDLVPARKERQAPTERCGMAGLPLP